MHVLTQRKGCTFEVLQETKQGHSSICTAKKKSLSERTNGEYSCCRVRLAYYKPYV